MIFTFRFVVIACALAGCASTPATPDAIADAATLDACGARGDTYVANLTKPSTDAAIRVRIVDATPAPPDKGTNEWTVQVVDAATNAPLEGAMISLTPFMPDHGHGVSVAPVITALGADGKYRVSQLYLPMPGLWKLTFVVRPAGSDAVREAVFQFCVEG